MNQTAGYQTYKVYDPNLNSASDTALDTSLVGRLEIAEKRLIGLIEQVDAVVDRVHGARPQEVKGGAFPPRPQPSISSTVGDVEIAIERLSGAAYRLSEGL